MDLFSKSIDDQLHRKSFGKNDNRSMASVYRAAPAGSIDRRIDTREVILRALRVLRGELLARGDRHETRADQPERATARAGTTSTRRRRLCRGIVLPLAASGDSADASARRWDQTSGARRSSELWRAALRERVRGGGFLSVRSVDLVKPHSSRARLVFG